MTEPANSSTGYRNTFWWRLYDRAAQTADQKIGWDKLPKPIGLLVLIGLRNILRQRNLYDTSSLPAHDPVQPGPQTTAALSGRTADGSYNDLQQPTIGMAGTRFGRNIPLSAAYQESPADLLSPNPRTVSRELLTRTT